jgi:alkylated DNA nucleotide flippase Atl1
MKEIIIKVPKGQIITIFGSIDIIYGLNRARHVEAMKNLENMGFI